MTTVRNATPWIHVTVVPLTPPPSTAPYVYPVDGDRYATRVDPDESREDVIRRVARFAHASMREVILWDDVHEVGSTDDGATIFGVRP
jgi:hypothetical protein